MSGGYNWLQRWGDRVPGSNIFDLRYILYPVNVNNGTCWTLLVVKPIAQDISYYDSKNGSGDDYMASFVILKKITNRCMDDRRRQTDNEKYTGTTTD